MRLLVEVRRRGILKVATAYLVVSWLTLEIGHVLFNIFELPHAGLQVIFVLLALGFPLTLFAVWQGWLATLTGAPASSEASHAAPEAGHHGGGHEGALLAVIFGVVALIAVATVIGVRFFGMGHSPPGHGGGHEVAATAEPHREPARRAAPARNSVAVLPFADLSPGKDQAYLSDGLADALRKVAAASGVGVRIDAEALPIEPCAREWWTARGVDPVSAAVRGGDDYELLFAVPPRSRGALRSVARHVADPPLTKIGMFTKDPRELVVARTGNEDALPEGFEHFANR